jgi:hypothetical protein
MVERKCCGAWCVWCVMRSGVGRDLDRDETGSNGLARVGGCESTVSEFERGVLFRGMEECECKM